MSSIANAPGSYDWDPLAIDLDGTKGGYANRRLPTAALG